MERRGDSGPMNLFWPGDLAAGEVRIEGEPAHHARVRRVQAGDAVRILDGRGHVASGKVLTGSKNALVVDVRTVSEVPRPVALEVIVPVADRDRMLLAAEKCVELQVTSWRPAYFARSRSVSPRGEGARFRDKVRARMQSALEQSGGAWLPEVRDEAEIGDVWAGSAADLHRLVLDPDGPSLPSLAYNSPMAVAVGPEGGIEEQELTEARERGWLTASVGQAILRFETAIIAGVAVIRAVQLQRRSH